MQVQERKPRAEQHPRFELTPAEALLLWARRKGRSGVTIRQIHAENGHEAAERIQAAELYLRERFTSQNCYNSIRWAYRAKSSCGRAAMAGVPMPGSAIEKMMVDNHYQEACLLEQETGVRFVVDHIWPIRRGGPHLPWNLQVITAGENTKKGNDI